VKLWHIVLSSMLISAQLTACGSRSPIAPIGPANPISISGTVQFFDLEGGFWAIKGDDGIIYDPKDPWPDRYRIQNLCVGILARVRTDLASVHMVGPVVEIVEILALSPNVVCRSSSALPRASRR
jgi:hypothetical protein